jgi:hypothetical protein
LAPFSFAPTFFDITSIFTTLHLESNGSFLLFFEDYKPNQDLELSFDSFKLANVPFGMVFEHLRDYYHPQDLTSGFLHLFQFCFHIA